MKKTDSPKTKKEMEREEKKKKEEREKAKAEREKLAKKKMERENIVEEAKPEKETSPDSPLPKSGEGTLSVHASPWGKISVSGVVSGSERPVSKSVAYGDYQVNVSFRNLEGEWKTVSRNVRVAKANTVCSAVFRPDGEGVISCN
ncbi:MAG: hypothetical protein U1F57_06070 [bacterium]